MNPTNAIEGARTAAAAAYTIGLDIVFGSGQYAPATRGGRRLLANELAHVIQSRPTSANQAEPLTLENGRGRAESEATRIGNRVQFGMTSGPAIVIAIYICFRFRVAVALNGSPLRRDLPSRLQEGGLR